MLHGDARSRVWLYFFHLPPYGEMERNNLNIAHCFCQQVRIKPRPPSQQTSALSIIKLKLIKNRNSSSDKYYSIRETGTGTLERTRDTEKVSAGRCRTFGSGRTFLQSVPELRRRRQELEREDLSKKKFPVRKF